MGDQAAPQDKQARYPALGWPTPPSHLQCLSDNVPNPRRPSGLDQPVLGATVEETRRQQTLRWKINKKSIMLIFMKMQRATIQSRVRELLLVCVVASESILTVLGCALALVLVFLALIPK